MLEKAVLPLALIALMLGLGMTLRRDDFARIARRKPVIAAALASIFLVMPIIALGIGRISNLDASLSMGLVLLAVCPGGMLSNMVTHSFRGDVVLSLALTVSSTFIYALVAPFIATLFLTHTAGGLASTVAAMLHVVAEVTGVVVVPLLIGMSLRSATPRFCARVDVPLRWAATCLVCLVFLWLGYSQVATFEAAGWRLVGAVVLLNLSGWVLGGVIGLVFKLPISEFIAVGVEHSIRQEGTGVFVAVSILRDRHMAIPLLVNSAVGFISALLINGITVLLAGRKRPLAVESVSTQMD